MTHSDPIMVGVPKSHLTFFTACHKPTELNKVLMVAHGMGQWEEGGTVLVGRWVSVNQLGG